MFLVFNHTDGVFATPDRYKTLRAGIEALLEVRAKFVRIGQAQGHYRTSRGQEIDPRFVELAVWSEKGFYRQSESWHFNDNYDSPAEQLAALSSSEKLLGGALAYGPKVLFKKVAELGKGYTLNAELWKDGAQTAQLQILDPAGFPLGPVVAGVFVGEGAPLMEQFEALKTLVRQLLPGMVATVK
jgi:hypothetical protein